MPLNVFRAGAAPITVVQTGTGGVTFAAPAGVALLGTASLSVQYTAAVLTLQSPNDWVIAQPAAAPPAVLGAPVVRKSPFAFDTPGLLTGHAVYTPTVGDVLLDAWVEVDTAWDGVTPKGDVGDFVGGHTGLFKAGGAALDLTLADTLVGQVLVGGGPTDLMLAATGFRLAPNKFTTADPIQVVVSQDGTNNGADPGSTQGTAVLYLVTATPV